MDRHPIEIAAEIAGSYEALAKQLGVTRAAVHQWTSPTRKVPIEHCARIEAITKGAVTRQMLRPDDWQSIWPELIAQSSGDQGASSDDTQPPAGVATGKEKS
jgi:DNA-binding transcriptional regulator YdaS (Cro superfamily)